MHKTLFKTLIVTLIFASDARASTIVVNTIDPVSTADDGFCTMHEAVDAANNNVASGTTLGECVAGEPSPTIDRIEFAPEILPATFTPITPYELYESVNIVGPDKSLVTFSQAGVGRSFIIVGGGGQTVDQLAPNQQFRISDVSFLGNFSGNSTILGNTTYNGLGGAILAILDLESDLTLRRVDFIDNQAIRGGGALAIFGSSSTSTTLASQVKIIDCYFKGNNAFNNNDVNNPATGGGALFIGAGYGVEISHSTFESNWASNWPLTDPQFDASGGAVLIRSSQGFLSTLTIDSSTFSNNAATGEGGAIEIGGQGYPLEISQVTIRNSTITENVADSNDDLLYPDHGGGGIYSSSSSAINLKNTILAMNVDHSNSPRYDLAGAAISYGNNFLSDNIGHSGSFPAGQPNANNDWVGSYPSLLDPLLQPLADNGGRMTTHMPENNSLVLDQGKCLNQQTDQRYREDPVTHARAVDLPGIANISGGDGCDIGAVEFGATPANAVPVAADDSYEILEGQTLSIDASTGLLSNDNDPDTSNIIVLTVGNQNISTADISGTLYIDIHGALQFTPGDPDNFGQFTIPYEVTDKYSIASANLTVNVLPVNDAPSFTPGTLSIQTNPGKTVSIPNWAQNISPGPANESTQNTSFIVTTQPQTGFFSTPPSVDDATGTLDFTVANTASGSAQITVSLHDDGGTMNGGMDTSTPVIIQVNAQPLPNAIFSDGFE